MAEGAPVFSTSPFAFSVDVEDWFNSSRDLFAETDSREAHPPDPSVVSNTRDCLEALKSAGNFATFFILTPVAEHYPHLIREIMDGGHEIAVHGYRHSLLYNLTPDEFRDDLEMSLDILHRAGARDILGFRAPYWSITRQSLWALDILQEYGFRYDSSVFPIRRKLYGIADAPRVPHEIRDGLWEFPPATYRVAGLNLPVAGGGYLRVLPGAIARYLIDRLARAGRESVFYCHPYELDPSDIRPKVSLTSVASYARLAQQICGRGDNPGRLRAIISRYRFVTIASLLECLQGGRTA